MFTVPVVGDVIQTVGNVQRTVLSYSAYRDAPAVYAQVGSDAPENVPFDQIEKINGTPVKLNAGKLFDASSIIKRAVQLPQANDTVIVAGGTFKVKSLKLHERGNLTQGMLLQVLDETKDKTSVRLADVERIVLANGDTTVSMRSLKNQYAEYLGST